MVKDNRRGAVYYLCVVRRALKRITDYLGDVLDPTSYVHDSAEVPQTNLDRRRKSGLEKD